jgi:ammonium transporter, Amt family
VFVAFQATFAAITTALIVGAFAERMKFSAVLLFAVLWFTFAYVPMAHMVWGGGSSTCSPRMGALDFAGGTVVHINAGIAGLVGAYVVGKRIGYGREALTPHNAHAHHGRRLAAVGGLVRLQRRLRLAANGVAGLAFINTVLATAAAVLSWIAGEAMARGKASMLGAASGAVAGLVAITPAADSSAPWARSSSGSSRASRASGA